MEMTKEEHRQYLREKDINELISWLKYVREDFVAGKVNVYHQQTICRMINLLYGGVDALLRGDEQIGWKDRYRAYRLQSLATRWVDSLYRLDLVVEECNAVAVVAKGGHNIYRVALDAERSGR